MNPRKRLRIKIVRVGCRVPRNLSAIKRPLTTSKSVLSFWNRVVRREEDHEDEKENLCVILVDTNLRAINWNRVSVGNINECTASPREIYRAAIVCAAYGIILIHNHPSGNPAPSPEDKKLTGELRKAGDLLKIRLYEHLIVGSTTSGYPKAYSFRDAGIL